MIYKITRIGSDPVIVYAAEELKRCLGIMAPELDIIILSYPEWRRELTDALWIGIDSDLPIKAPDVADRSLDDSIAIQVSSGYGYITGVSPRAVLIAAFRYLRELGAAWIRPKDGEILPPCDILSKDVAVSEVPSCRHRGVCIEGADSVEHVISMIDWLPRVGMNSYFFQFRIPATFYERWYGHYLGKTSPEQSLSLIDFEGIRNAAVDEIKKRGLLYHAAGHGWTCEPFGISGTGWDADREHYVPEESKKYLAEVNGRRELWGNVPLDTNLCYSNPEVRDRISTDVAEYCKNNSAIDYIHVWLADGVNNHCECPECARKRPSDWYIEILNEIDRKLTAADSNVKVVFLMYEDLFWPPVETELKNPDRFVLMFAPITRTYSETMTEALEYDEKLLPDYVRNKCKMPRSVGENLCWLKQWQKIFKGDSFDFDYHYMWDHHRDIAQMSMNRVLFDDMAGLHKVGLNGMISCQNQRVWMPSGFGMTAMAAALWNSDTDYDSLADRHFTDAFGDDGTAVREYLEKLSRLFCPKYFRGETEKTSPEAAESLSKIPEYLKSFTPLISANLKRQLPPAQKKSWKYLEYHSALCSMLAPAAQARAEGDDEKAKLLFNSLASFAYSSEDDIADALDVFELVSTLSRLFR